MDVFHFPLYSRQIESTSSYASLLSVSPLRISVYLRLSAANYVFYYIYNLIERPRGTGIVATSPCLRHRSQDHQCFCTTYLRLYLESQSLLGRNQATASIGISQAGSSIVKVQPSPRTLSTRILPSCKSIICRVIYSPSPVEDSPPVGCADKR